MKKEAIVVCAANLSGTDKCPLECRKCWYGGNIAISWTCEDQEYIQFYPSWEHVLDDYHETKWFDDPLNKAKAQALKQWLDQH